MYILRGILKKFCENNVKGTSRHLRPVIFPLKLTVFLPVVFFKRTKFNKVFISMESAFSRRLFRSVVTARECFKYQPWGKRTKYSCLKFSKYKADIFDMIQNALEDNMDKALVYKWTKRETV